MIFRRMLGWGFFGAVLAATGIVFAQAAGDGAGAPPVTNQAAEEGKAAPSDGDNQEPEPQRDAQPAEDPLPLGDAERDDPLERAVNRMRTAHERIAQRDPGVETQGLQEQVIADLQKLIDLLQRQRQSPQSPPQGSPPQKPQPRSKNQQQDPRNSGTRQGQRQKQNTASRRESKQAQESAQRNSKGNVREAEEARRKQLVRDVWGHLPETVRMELLNVYRDKFLPKYEDLVREYYEALAERSRERSPRP